jgi:hypothetical protein
MTYGLLQPTDLNGRWEPIDDSLQLLQPSGRYDDKSVAEFKRSYFIEANDNSPDLRETIIIHDLRRYDLIVPEPGELKIQLDSRTPGGRPYDPGVLRLGVSNQTLCQTDDLSRLKSTSIICMAETRYSHFISTIYFYFDASISKTDMKALINQALTETDERIQELDQHLNEESS